MPLCEWGNACFGWMLEELSSENRLTAFRAENDASYKHYSYMIANSTPFYERWKNWRFSRRVYIPDYISKIDEKSSSVFLALQSGDDLSLIAQNLKSTENDIRKISRQIVIELTKRKRLYLLDPPSITSMSGTSDDEGDLDVADLNGSDGADEIILQQQKEQLLKAWGQLTALEQFVLESLVIDKQDASVVLKTIIEQADNFPHSESDKIKDRQQLYYFRRNDIKRWKAKDSSYR